MIITRSKEKGKQQHREAEKRRRLKIWLQGRHNDCESKRPIAKEKKDLKNYKKYTLTLFQFQTLANKRVVGEKAYCHFCGSLGLVVEKFPRRGYGYRWKEEQSKKSQSVGQFK